MVRRAVIMVMVLTMVRVMVDGVKYYLGMMLVFLSHLSGVTVTLGLLLSCY